MTFPRHARHALVDLIRRRRALRRTLSAQNGRLRDRTAALELLQRVANAANESTSSDEALTRAIREICTATGWPVGHVYVKEPGFPQLAPRPLWYVDDPDRWVEFVQLSDALHFVSGHGLPGLVLERGAPVWLEAGMDGDDGATYPRAALARELGIRSFFAFPIWVGNEIAAVLEFFSTEEVDPDGGLTELAGPIGVQLARVLERERAEAAMRASESRFRSLVDNVPGAIYRISCEYGVRTVEYLSDDIEDIVGYTAADFVEGRITAQDVIHPDDLAANDRAMTRAAEFHSRFSLEYRMIHRDGGVRWVSESGRAMHDEAGGSTWFDGSIVDVTVRRKGEEALAHLAAIVESSQDAIIGTTLDGTIVSFNRAAERLYGYKAAEIVGTSMAATVPPDRVHERGELLGRAARAEVIENFETVRIRKDGTTVDVSLTISPVRNAAGAIEGASVIARDITAAKEGERKLREAEDRFRALAEQLPLTTYIDAADASGNSYVSPQIEAMSGYPAAEWLANPGHFASRLHPDDRERVLAAIGEAAEAGAALSQEYRFIARDGSTVWLRDSAVTVLDAEGGPAYRQGYAIEITAAKEAEDLLQRDRGEVPRPRRAAARRDVRRGGRRERRHRLRQPADRAAAGLHGRRVGRRSRAVLEHPPPGRPGVGARRARGRLPRAHAARARVPAHPSRRPHGLDPGRDAHASGRGRRTALCAGVLPRHHRPQGRRRAPAHRRGPLPDRSSSSCRWPSTPPLSTTPARPRT